MTTCSAKVVGTIAASVFEISCGKTNKQTALKNYPRNGRMAWVISKIETEVLPNVITFILYIVFM